MGESVAAMFEDYRKVIPETAPEIQIEETRRAFYAGAYYLLTSVAKLGGDTEAEEEAGVQQLQALKDECEVFAANLTNAAPPMDTSTIEDRRVNYHMTMAAKFQPILRDYARAIKETLPEGWGFNLMLFEFKGGTMFYISNADRSDVMSQMRDFLKRNTQ
jgi:hypothetical protein